MSALMTTEQLAKYLGVSPGTLRNWRSQGRGPAYLLIDGRQVRYRTSDVEAWLEAQLVRTL